MDKEQGVKWVMEKAKLINNTTIIIRMKTDEVISGFVSIERICCLFIDASDDG